MDEEVMFECDICGKDVIEGEEYYLVGSDRVCTDCIEAKTAKIETMFCERTRRGSFDYEPEVVHTCECCGKAICEGDEYYEVLGDTYCDECVDYRTA